jgi:hypothetical protein
MAPRPPPAFRIPGMRPEPRGVVVVGFGFSGSERVGGEERDGSGGVEGKQVLLACCQWRIERCGGDSSALPTLTARHRPTAAGSAAAQLPFQERSPELSPLPKDEKPS